MQRVKDGYDIEEVVAEYNILRGCIHDLAQANGLTLQGEPFHILNRVLDGAIGLAVKTFAAAAGAGSARPPRRVSRLRGARSAHAAECDFARDAASSSWRSRRAAPALRMPRCSRPCAATCSISTLWWAR